MQNFTKHPDTNVSIFLMGWVFKCNLLCLLNLYNRYCNQVHTKHKNFFSISLVSEQKQAREYMQFTAVEVFIYLFVCVKDRACLKIVIVAYFFNIFIVCIGVSTPAPPLKNTTRIFHAKHPLKSANLFCH